MIERLKQILGWSADTLASQIFPSSQNPQTPEARRLLSELRQRVHDLPPLPTVGSDQVEEEWVANLRQLRDALARDDPWRFTRWPVIRRTMFMANSVSALREWQYLRSLPDWPDRWRSALRESHVGSPVRFLLSPWTSGSLIHHAAHLARFEESSGRRVDRMEMVWEFGGGYGGMCRILHQLGFDRRYLIFDLPEMTALQAYFLRSLGLPFVGAADFAAGRPGIFLASDLGEVGRLVSPTGSTPAQSLFIATWSLSEVPPALRARVLSLAAGFGSYLVAYQRGFGSVENQSFFERWAGLRSDVSWQRSPIAHLKGNYYLFGTRRDSLPDAASAAASTGS
jgi:hypothetical protein